MILFYFVPSIAYKGQYGESRDYNHVSIITTLCQSFFRNFSDEDEIEELGCLSSWNPIRIKNIMVRPGPHCGRIIGTTVVTEE